MKKTIVIYRRADFDGIFCREIARKFLPDAELIGWDYGDPVPDIYRDTVPVDIDLYMLDISVEGLMEHPNLIWIDHHKSAMEKFPATIDGYCIDGVAACRLAWQWFAEFLMHDPDAECHAMIPGSQLPNKKQFIDRAVQEPWAVRLAGEYDIFDKRDPDAELFQHGLRAQELTGDHWAILLSPDDVLMVPLLLDRGRSVQYASTQQNESIIKAAGFDLEFEGLKFLACNHARYNSHLFTAGLKPEHDACFGFAWRDGKWVISLYHAPGKEHHDLSLIAVKYGGGGHKGACGFRCESLPFIK